MIREAFSLLEAFEKSPKGASDSMNIKFLRLGYTLQLKGPLQSEIRPGDAGQVRDEGQAVAVHPPLLQRRRRGTDPPYSEAIGLDGDEFT